MTSRTVDIKCGLHDDTTLYCVIWYIDDIKLSIACISENIEAVNSLRFTADVNLQKRYGRTPLHVACRYGKADAVQMSLSVSPNTDITDDYRRTPIETANFYGNNEVITFFSPLASTNTVNLVANVTKNRKSLSGHRHPSSPFPQYLVSGYPISHNCVHVRRQEKTKRCVGG